ncbi:hypothetical protein CH063_04315, partial [Colletotrichum higginsianum]
EDEKILFEQFGEILSKNSNMKVSAYNYGDGPTTFVASKGEEAKLSGGYTNYSDDDTSAKIGYVRVGMDMDGSDPDAVFKTVEASTRASVYHVANNNGSQITQQSADILSAKVSTGVSGISGGNDGFPVYAGAEAKLNFLELKGSVFDAEVGLSAQTDLRFKDYSMGGHVLGIGCTVGKRVSVSTPFGSVEMDFSRGFN